MKKTRTRNIVAILSYPFIFAVYTYQFIYLEYIQKNGFTNPQELDVKITSVLYFLALFIPGLVTGLIATSRPALRAVLGVLPIIIAFYASIPYVFEVFPSTKQPVLPLIVAATVIFSAVATLGGYLGGKIAKFTPLSNLPVSQNAE